MPDTGAPWNIPYVAGTDLVSDWPTDSLALANAIDAGLDAASVGIGSNVVQTVKTDTFTTTSTSFVDVTGLTVSITPTNATSKILVVGSIYMSNTTTGRGGHIRLDAGGSDTVYIGDASGNRIQTTVGLSRTMSDATPILQTFVYLHSPATTSSVTYKIVGRIGDSGTLSIGGSGFGVDVVNRATAPSSLTVIEVAA